MSKTKIAWSTFAAGVALAAYCLSVAPAADPPAEAPLVIIDAAGKETKLKSWKFVAGTRTLAWLAPAPKEEDKPRDGDKPKDEKPKDGEKPKAPEPLKLPLNKTKGPAGPEALKFRDDQSTNFQDGVLTLIPLTSLQSLDFDAEKKEATVKVAIAGDKDATESITGTTKYGDNHVTIEAEVSKGDMGVAEVKYLGGTPKGIKGVRFPDPKPMAAVPKDGRPATVVVGDTKGSARHNVVDLVPLYRFVDGSEKILPTLFFKKTLKIDTAMIKSIKPKGKGEEGPEWGVTLKEGEEETYTLLTKVTLDGKPATLDGLIARVPAGYKLYPLHTISEITFEDAKKE